MIDQVITTLATWIVEVISAAGYFGVVILMAIESACIPLPSEVIMPFAGYLVTTGRFSLVGAATMGALGCNIGSTVAYYVAASGGRAAIERWGRYILVSRHELERAERFFARYGAVTVFICRLLPVVRTFIAFPAGLGKTGRERDEGPHPREQAADGNSDSAVTREEPLGALQLVAAHKDVAAPALDRGPPAARCNVIGDRRADIAPQRAHRGGADQAEPPGRDEISGERHDHFGRQRNAGRLDRHQNDDTKITGGRNDLDNPGRERRNDLVNHCCNGGKAGRSASLARTAAFEHDDFATRKIFRQLLGDFFGNAKESLAAVHFLPDILWTDTGGDPQHHQIIDEIGAFLDHCVAVA